ncbi:hypothetical protein SPBR_08599 [Sporothrix brasiliensis 5110]|uniref:PPPDE domain-containing protein n=1 Tax=Sporothrix brasiliensis 5110 TaxID=1398154 RepID=A0A0C2EJS8_9PEZI|nr:uncharacterized protein SPBR_08599 [Sporothrix brasiliensis 5110]KIH86289.1 hypothetical protein SPBR_08599 [Sporothrix brasiliensis 5110]
MAPKKYKKTSSRASHRSTLSLQKTEIVINVYDLLTPSRWSSLLWHMGTSLLHSGVVINGREYAYGGHDRHGITGVYWTSPRHEPPGGTFRCEILQGFTLATPAEIDAIIRSASEAFHGPSYNLLTKNCNHFTAFLCRKLTGRPGPAWLNRAASIGLALPCLVPREWVEPPEFDSADGELLHPGGGSNGYEDSYSAYGDDDDDDAHGERTSMLRQSSQHQIHLVGLDSPPTSARSSMTGTRASDEYHPEPFEEGDADIQSGRRSGTKGKGRTSFSRDSAGNAMPPSERVPTM